MTSPEFRDNQEAPSLWDEVAELLDTPENPNRYQAPPSSITPEATDFLNNRETIVFGIDKLSLFEDR